MLSLAQQSVPRIAAATLPIIIRNEVTPELIGTGVLIQHPKEVVLVTAAHVADYYLKGEVLLTKRRLADRDSIGIPLGPPLWKTSAPKEYADRSDDPYDLAVVRFPRKIRLLLCEHYEPLKDDELQLAADKTCEFYVSHGFPCSLSPASPMTMSLKLNPFTFVAHSPDEARDLKPPHHPKAEIVVVYSDRHPSQAGQTMPHPRGMSGAGLWTLTKKESGGTWSVKDVRLAGILHTYQSNSSVVRATRIEHFITAINKTFSETPEYDPKI